MGAERSRIAMTMAQLAMIVAFGSVFLGLADVEVPAAVWAGFFAVYFVLNAGRLKTAGAAILGVSVILFTGSWLLTGEPHAEGFGRAGFLFVFLMVMQYMADLADRTPGISSAAELIVSRPPGQRYLFVTFGTHVFALFLQIGAIILIMTLLASRLKNADRKTVRALTVAAQRGFASTGMWSPLSLGILIIFAHVSGVNYVHFIPLGLGSAVLFLLCGYWMERGRRARMQEAAPITRGQWIQLSRVVGLAVLLVGGGLTWVAVFDVPLIEAMFSVVFLLGVAWSVLAAFAGRLTFAQAGSSFIRAGSTLANEVAIISGAAIIGAVGSGLIARWHGLDSMVSPQIAALIALLIPAVLFAGAMLALNPVLTATLVASALNPVWPEDGKLWLVLALTWGWAVAASSPFTANVLITAQKVGQPGHTIALNWNGRFTALTFLGFSLAAGLGTWLAVT